MLFSKGTGASLLVAGLANVAASQFVKAPANLTKTTGYADIPVRYKEVPAGTCEVRPDVKSFSGYADVSENEHIFFWFFEARNADPKTAPLTVWINGGPGSSSMIGLFQELGPCRIDENLTVVDNPYAWNNVSNIVFIDQPAQVGFSYSIPIPAYQDPDSSYIIQLPNATCPDYAEGYGTCGTYPYPNASLTANSTVNDVPNLWKTLQGFMGAFPQYSRHGFNFATESYGGHYGPIFNAYLESQNKLIANGSLPSAHHIDLKTVLIGNGWYDPLIQYAAYYNYTVSPGNTYDYVPFNESVSAQMYNAMFGPGNCADQTRDCYARGDNDICSAADNFCADEVESMLDNYVNRDEYDIRELSPDPFPENYYVDYLNLPKVQEAIGAFINFSDYSSTVSNAFGSTGDDDREVGTIEAMRSLVDQGLTVVMYTGDADYNCNWLGGEVVASEIAAPGFSTAGYTNISTSDNMVHGQVKQAGKFAFLRIYESGHEVPYYQPVVALEMFQRAISGKDIATGLRTVSGGHKTVGTAKSTYREGNSTIQFEVVDTGATSYNTTTDEPNPIVNGTGVEKRSLESAAEKKKKKEEKKTTSKRLFKPLKRSGMSG